MNDKNQRLAGVRQWLQRDDERRAREAALPKALCRICGGWANAGEGFRDEAPAKGLVVDPTNPERRRIAEPVHAPTGADDWRRECETCVNATMATVVGAVVEAVVEERDAGEVVRRMKSFDPELRLHVEFPTAQSMGTATGKPWGHVTSVEREKVRGVLAAVIRERQIGPCVQGACGMCGVRAHRRWLEAPLFLRWPDATPAPVCGDCFAVLDRRPEVTSIEQLRVVGVEAATGFSQMYYTAPDSFRLYAETRDCDGNGHAEAWDYGEGIRQFREETWTDHPRLAPEDRRAEFAQRLRERAEEASRQQQLRNAPTW